MEHNYQNYDNAPHLMTGDSIKIHDTESNQDFEMIVHSHGGINKRNQEITQFSMQGKFTPNKHPDHLLEKPLFTPDKAPIVVMYDVNHPKAFHTAERTINAIREIQAQFPTYKVTDLDTRESHLKGKYSNYPYKRIKSLVNSNKRSNMNYEIVEGEVLDPDLMRKVKTKHVYYLKALRDFTVKSSGGNYQVAKNQVSGPLVLSTNPDMQKAQLKAMREASNSRSMQNKQFGVEGREQNFWLDQASSLQGNWHMPDSGLMINSDVKMKEYPEQNVKKGFIMDNGCLSNSEIYGQKGSVILSNSTLEHSFAHLPSDKMLIMQNSTLLADTDKLDETQMISDSVIGNSKISGSFNANNAFIKRPLDKSAIVMHDTILSQVDRQYSADKVDLTGKEISNDGQDTGMDI